MWASRNASMVFKDPLASTVTVSSWPVTSEISIGTRSSETLRRIHGFHRRIRSLQKLTVVMSSTADRWRRPVVSHSVSDCWEDDGVRSFYSSSKGTRVWTEKFVNSSSRSARNRVWWYRVLLCLPTNKTELLFFFLCRGRLLPITDTSTLFSEMREDQVHNHLYHAIQTVIIHCIYVTSFDYTTQNASVAE